MLAPWGRKVYSVTEILNKVFSDLVHCNVLKKCIKAPLFPPDKLLVTIIEGDQKAPFSIGTTPRCRGGCYSLP